ncbi:MAG: GspE/PulE family protein [Schwartzia sp. (in: firmicutes)]
MISLAPEAQSHLQKLVEQSLLGARHSGHISREAPNVSAAPIVTLVDRIIQTALTLGASDIHIEPVADHVRVRLRIDGVLSELPPSLPMELKDVLLARIKVMAHLDTTMHNLPQDGRITYRHRDMTVDVRVSTMPVMEGEKIVLRLLGGGLRLRRTEELDLSPSNLSIFHRWCRAPYGLILHVGPVNSGKTTSLYAALHLLNVPEKNIVTIEDPVEYYLPGINQVQVNTKAGLTFAAGLRSLLRQDPDICMVGEIRDEETAEIAVRAALTGRLLFTTLHTGRAAGAVFRLLDMGIKPYFLGTALLGICAQRLVRRLCPVCREEYEITPASREASLLGKAYRPGQRAFRARGCPACRGTGYRGRVAIHELLPFSENVQAAVAAGEKLRVIEETAIREGMVPLHQDGMQKVLAGQTTWDEIQRGLYGDDG